MSINETTEETAKAILLDDKLHVVPVFGRRHEASSECWCEPEVSCADQRIYVHHQEQ